MKIYVENLTSLQVSFEVDPESGETIRELLAPKNTPGYIAEIGARIDPYTLQSSPQVQELLQNSVITITVEADINDLAIPVLTVEDGGAVTGTRPAINLIEGTNIGITTFDNAAENRVDVTLDVTSAGAGDVVGPGSATNTAVALYDGTTGKVIKNSTVTIDGSGNIATTGTVDGRDVSADGAVLDLLAEGQNINVVRTVRNETGAPIADRTLVAVVSRSGGGIPIVDIADKDDPTLRPAFAVTLETIANNDEGDALIFGILSGVNTSALDYNDQLVLGSAGAFSRPPPDNDPFTGEIQNVGQVLYPDAAGVVFFAPEGLNAVTSDQVFALTQAMPHGWLSGGVVTRAGGLDVDVTGGEGYVFAGGTFQRVIWAADTIAVPASTSFWIYVDPAGVVQAANSQPDYTTNIVIATGRSSATDIIILSAHVTQVSMLNSRIHEYAESVIGNVTGSGTIASINAGDPLHLDVTSGTFWVGDIEKTVTGTVDISFPYWRRDGVGDPVFDLANTAIDPDNYDNAGSFDAVPVGKWIKPLLMLTELNGAPEYSVVHAQEYFNTQSEAESGALPVIPIALRYQGIKVAGIVIQQGSSAITSIVDHRQFVGQLSPNSTSIPTDHNFLTGRESLTAHTQYQLKSEKDAASGYAGLDGSGAISGTAHGAQAGGTLHATAVAGVSAGFISAANQTKLDGVETGADVTDETNVTAAHPIVDSTELVKDPGDPTRRMRIDVGNVATSTTRVLTMPNQDIDLTPNTGAFAAALHAARHQLAGADPINVGGLSGVLAAAQLTEILKAGSSIGTRPAINFIEGSNVTLTIADDAGNNRVNITAAAATGTGPTKDLFLRPECNANVGSLRTRSIGSTGQWRFPVVFPQDFSSIISLGIIGFATGAGAVGTGRDIDLTSEYGQITEPYNNHSQASTVATYTIPALSQLFELNLAPVFTSASASDVGGVIVDHNGVGGSIDYIFVHLRYS